jgi:hypothetical protein
MATTARLPGIQFEVVAPPASEALVRMDIAAFVGFTASGPLDQPVAVESIADFEEIFGSDLPIAGGSGPNQPAYAYLPSAVRAFFRNGGRRCWVVRVAGASAETNSFPVPGLYVLQDGAVAPALAPARSEGSWSDGFLPGIALNSHAVIATSFTSNPYTVGLALQAPDEVAPGDLLRLTFPGKRDVLWLFVDTVIPDTGTSPPLGFRAGRLVTATALTVFWEELASPLEGGQTQSWHALASPPTFGSTLPVCERITMELFVRSESGDAWALNGLGFAPAHPFYWGDLPDDAALYAMDAPSGLALDAAHPRFPLGFPLAGPAAGRYFLPLGAGPLPVFKLTSPPLRDPIERDGLAVFESHLFLDSSLRDVTSIDLLAEADYIRYQRSQPRTLRGIHAALAVEEATIIAAPDAVQRGWYRAGEEPLASPPASSPLQHPEWWHFLDCTQNLDIPSTNQPPAGQFEPCGLVIVPAPALSLTVEKSGVYSLIWTPAPNAADYLEEALDPAFATANVIYQGSSGLVTIYGRPLGDYYYRLRRQVGVISSNYSNGVAIRMEGAAGWQLNPVAEYQSQPLIDVHTALLRMCAARGDLFAALALPSHYRERDAMAHAAQLKAALGQAEQAALSFGGLYHPWLIGREENDVTNLRTNPPDGAAAGIMAKRSSQRGAWISPANEPLHGVAALDPPISRAYWQAMQDADINLLRQEAGGFLCLSESTLTDASDLGLINVRRLMSFLRKTALREGMEYVFEPNGDDFRRGVQRLFEKVLDQLFLRGAFAGRTAREAFQVVTDSSLNTPAATDRGEFYVELKVAPSVPMRFLTVRLLQTADRTLVTEGP